jgi:hypothetical protein
LFLAKKITFFPIQSITAEHAEHAEKRGGMWFSRGQNESAFFAMGSFSAYSAVSSAVLGS